MTDRPFKLKLTLWLIVAAVFILYFVWRLEWVEVRRILQNLDVTPVIAAILLTVATYVVRALRWRIFLSPIAQPSLRNLVAATAVGFSSIFIFGRIGEVARPVMLSLRERIRPSATFATILVERLFDSIVVVVVFAIDMVFFEQLIGNKELSFIRQAGFALLVILGLGLFGLSVYRSRVDSVLDFIARRLSWLPGRVRRVLLNFMRHLADGLYVLHDIKGFLLTLGYTVLVWTLVAASFWVLVRAFHLSLSVMSILFILGFSMVGSLVPTPGGSAGAFHTVTMVGLTILGLGRNEAASVAIIMHIVTFGSALIPGIYFFFKDGLSFKTLRGMVAQEMASLHGDQPSHLRTDAQTMGVEL